MFIPVACGRYKESSRWYTGLLSVNTEMRRETGQNSYPASTGPRRSEQLLLPRGGGADLKEALVGVEECQFQGGRGTPVLPSLAEDVVQCVPGDRLTGQVA